MLREITTPSGYKFWGESLVMIGDKAYPMDEMTEEQREWVATKLNIQGLNAAFRGQRTYYATNGMKPFEEVFPEIAAELEREKAAAR